MRSALTDNIMIRVVGFGWDELVAGTKRIDVLWRMEDTDKDGKKIKVNQWCQGKVVGIVSEETYEVEIIWDAMPDVDGWYGRSRT